MLDGTFVEAFETATRRPVSEGGRVFIPQGWSEQPVKIHAPGPLPLSTLTGFLDYLTVNRDGLALAELVVHVKDPGRVEVRGKLEDDETEFRRATYAVATTEMTGRCALPFGQYVDAEQFYIGLQVGFSPTDERDTLLRLIASIRENSVRETVDSGVSQEVKTGRGVALIGTATVPNPVTLAPYRTFREIDQPASLFVLRLKEHANGDKPQAALFEADGGAWKLRAIEAIALYLRVRLPDGLPVLA